jgi:uncharacterized protein
MLVAVLSDCHDNIWTLKTVLAEIQNAGAAIFCGDFCAPFSLKMMADGFTGPIHSVLGNNDGDVYLLSSTAGRAPNVTLYQPVAKLELDGRRIAIAHYPEVGEALARSGQFDAVFSGHTHRAQIETIGTVLWANPGEIMGRFGKPTYGLYDTGSNHMVLHTLP